MGLCHQSIAITHADDPRIAAFRFIRERDLHREDGLFVAEGEVVVRRLLTSRHFATHAVLVAAQHADKFEAMLAGMAEPPPLYVGTVEVLSEIAGFPLHRGILALGRRGRRPDLAEVLSKISSPALMLAAVSIANHDNMGALFRNAAAFGLDLVALDRTSCDPLYRKSLRVSVGAALDVMCAEGGTADDMVATLERHDVNVLALSPVGTVDLADYKPDRSRRIALLVGSEGQGLPASILARTRTVRIPMAAGWDSLNVATAAAIALYQLRQRLDFPPAAQQMTL